MNQPRFFLVQFINDMYSSLKEEGISKDRLSHNQLVTKQFKGYETFAT